MFVRKNTGIYDLALQKGFKYFIENRKNPWTGTDKIKLPFSIGQVIAEIHLTFECICKRELPLPDSLTSPDDKALRATSVDEGYEDYGNMVWEAMFWSCQFSKFCGKTNQDQLLACPNAPYGEKTNRSAVGPVNMRGNILETLLSFLYKEIPGERTSRHQVRPREPQGSPPAWSRWRS